MEEFDFNSHVLGVLMEECDLGISRVAKQLGKPFIDIKPLRCKGPLTTDQVRSF